MTSTYDRDYGLSRLDTYEFSSGEREKTDPLATNTLTEKKIKDALEEELQNSGHHPPPHGAAKTFNFVAQRFDGVLAHDTLNDGRIRHALESKLMAAGYGMEEVERPDFAVAYYVTSRNKFGVQDYGYGPPRWWGRRDIRVDEYTEGTLTLDLIDVRTRQLVWRGRISGTVELKGTDKKIDKAADKLVEQLPKDAKKGG